MVEKPKLTFPDSGNMASVFDYYFRMGGPTVVTILIGVYVVVRNVRAYFSALIRVDQLVNWESPEARLVAVIPRTIGGVDSTIWA